MKRIRMFLIKHVCIYACVIVAFLCLLMPLRDTLLRLARQNALAELQGAIDAGAVKLESRLTRMRDEASVLFRNNDVLFLTIFYDDMGYNTAVTSVLRVNTLLQGYGVLQDGTLAGLLMFRNNSLCLCGYGIYPDYRSMYDITLSVAELTAEEFHARVMGARENGVFTGIYTLSNFTFDINRPNRKVLMYLVPSHPLTGRAGAAMSFIIDADALLNDLFPEVALSTCLLELLGTDGQSLFSRNNDITDGEALMATSATSGYTLRIVVPDDVLYGFAARISDTVERFIWIGVALVLLAALLNITWQLLPLRRLLKRASDIISPQESGNGYRFIEQAIDAMTLTRDRSEQRVTMLQSVCHYNRLELACLRGVEQPDDAAQINAYLDNAPYCVCVLRTSKTRDNLFIHVDEALRKRAPQWRATVFPLVGDEIIMILCDIDVEQVEDVLARMTEIAAALGTDGTAAGIGVSRPVMGVENMHMAYNEAWRALRLTGNDYQNAATLYRVEQENGADEALSCAEQLSALILARNRDGVTKLFAVLREQDHGEQEWLQLYYALRAALTDAGRHAQSAYDLPQWHAHMTVGEALRDLEQTTLALCDSLLSISQKGNQTLKRDMVAFVRASLDNPQLCAAMVADHFHVVEKYVYQLVKESEGESFGAFVQSERLKMTAELLRDTSLSNEEIAQRTGFGAINTFYRVFKKQYGVSPSVWRQSRK